MLTAGLAIAALAAVIHVYIFVLESLRWTAAKTMRTFGVRTAADAETTRPLAYNQGFYNLFLAAGTALGIILAAGSRPAGITLVLFTTAFMTAAALVLITSDRSKARAAAVQGVPAVLALVLVALGG